MREILFKAKRLDSDNWVEGYVVFERYPKEPFIRPSILEVDKDGAVKIGSFDEDYAYQFIKVDAETLCQFTGMFDKNGVKIWENDIVQDVSTYFCHLGYVEKGIETKEQAEEYKNCGEIGDVKYSTDGEMGSCGCCFNDFVGAGFKADGIDLTTCFVIGNIFDDQIIQSNS